MSLRVEKPKLAEWDLFLRHLLLPKYMPIKAVQKKLYEATLIVVNCMK